MSRAHRTVHELTYAKFVKRSYLDARGNHAEFAQRGRVEDLAHLITDPLSGKCNLSAEDLQFLLHRAAVCNKPRTMEYLISLGALASTCTTEFAARNGFIECFRLIQRDRIPSTAAEHAAEQGRTEILRYLIEIGAPFTPRVFEDAASGGHLETLSLLLDSGRPVPFDICESAAESGCTDCFALLRTKGFQWYRTATIAAECGHPRLLKYAIENGCEVPLDASFYAIDYEREDCLRLLLVNKKISPSVARSHASGNEYLCELIDTIVADINSGKEIRITLVKPKINAGKRRRTN